MLLAVATTKQGAVLSCIHVSRWANTLWLVPASPLPKANAFSISSTQRIHGAIVSARESARRVRSSDSPTRLPNRAPTSRRRSGQVPEIGNHLCRQALASSRDTDQGDPLGSGQAIVAGFLGERPLAEPEPVFEDRKAAHVLGRLRETVEFKGIRLGEDILFVGDDGVDVPIVKRAFRDDRL